MIDIPFSIYWREYLVLFFGVVMAELAVLLLFAQVYGLVREIKIFLKQRKQTNDI